MFLSFRGDGDRYIFTGSFLKTLKGANIAILVDDETIKTPEDLKPELGIGIKEYRASIIVLLKNYTSWILILEQRITSNQFVIPIFYHVELTHIRKQEDTFWRT